MTKQFVTQTPEGPVRSNVDPNTDFTKLAKSNKTLDTQLRAAGKGDDRRPASNEQRLAANWCATFGHKYRYGICINGCGVKRRGKNS